jgi:hypothetical protein
MAMPKPIDTPVRKSITLPKSLWDEIVALRFELKISTEAEAVRRIVTAGIKAEWRRAKK